MRTQLLKPNFQNQLKYSVSIVPKLVNCEWSAMEELRDEAG